MIRVSLAFHDDSMPRTVFYELFAQAVRRSENFIADATKADILIPAEDTALETNWPRYGNQTSAYMREAATPESYRTYIKSLLGVGRRLCIVNMHPFIRIPKIARAAPEIFVADGCLAEHERKANPRTISMPALPISTPASQIADKTILASFRGVNSHPCRAALAKLHNGRDIICDIVPRENHVGLLDAHSGKMDSAFTTLMAQSVFAFVPRGDALFSYRLLEAMAFGCIPIVISDGWVLPFDRTIDWQFTALHIKEDAIAEIPAMLACMTSAHIDALQQAVRRVYARYFASLDLIVKTMLSELDALLRA